MPVTVPAVAVRKSVEPRCAARAKKAERERLIIDYLNRGVSVSEIAARLGVTEKRMRALVREILARRAPAAPERNTPPCRRAGSTRRSSWP